MSLLKNFATVGGATASSRVLGFVRDMFIAAALGTGPVADAFFVAFRFPNLFRRLFAEGAFNSAFVPLFAKALEGDGETEARRFGEEALSGAADRAARRHRARRNRHAAAHVRRWRRASPPTRRSSTSPCC